MSTIKDVTLLPPGARDAMLDLAALAQLPEALRALAAAVRAMEARLDALDRRLPPQLLTTAEVAKVLGVSVSTVTRRVRTGELPTVKKGKTTRIDARDLHRVELADVQHHLRAVTARP
jgi:excisionase family DNA binding protein